MKRYFYLTGLTLLAILLGADMAFAADDGGSAGGMAAVGAGIAIGVAALGGTLGQGKAVASGLDSIGRNPSAAGKLQTPMIIGLAFMESLVILSFIVAYGIAGKV